MRALYIGRYFMRDSHDCNFTGVSLPILERKSIKNNLKKYINKPLIFDNINHYNVKMYYSFINHFIKEQSMTSYTLRVKKYKRSEYCKQLLKIIEHDYYLFNEPLRVYIPFDKNKNFIRTLNKMIKKRKLNVFVEEIRYEESVFSQLANIISGCVYYHDREDLYEANMGKKGKPQLIDYVYSCRKTKNKFIIEDYSVKK